MTETGLSLGTPHYMSPEQATADRTITARSDIYSLAAVLYEMLTGEPPHMGTSAQQIIMKIVTDVPRRVGELRKATPPNVEAAITKALDKLPADRFDSARAFAEALANPSFGARRADTGTARAPASPHAFRWWIRSAWTWATLSCLAVVLMWAWLGGRRPGAASVATSVIRPIRLTHSGGVGCAAISPDGREFAAILGGYTEETNCFGKLVIRAVPTGVDQLILPNVRLVTRLRWNPTGTMLLLQGGPEDKPEGLWMLQRSGGAPRLLTTNPIQAFGFVADGRIFAFGPSGLYLMDPTSAEVLDSVPGLRATGGGAVEWSPDGTRLIVRNAVGHEGVFLMTTKGVVTDSLTGNIDAAFWAGRHRVIYYLDRGFGPGDLFTREVDVATGRFRGPAALLWAALPALRDVTSTVDGNRVMVVIRAVVDEQHVMQLDPRTESRVLVRSRNAYLGDPHLSPDAARIAYTREDALGFNAYWIGADGGPEHPVSSDTTPVINAEWIDDHRVITTATGYGRAEIDLDNGRVRRVAESSDRHLLEYLGDTWIWQRGDSLHLSATDERGSPVGELGVPPGLLSISSHWFPTRSYLVLAGPTRDQRLAMVGYSFAAARWSEPVPLPTADGFRIAGAGSDGSMYFARLRGARTEIWRSRDYRSPPALLLTLPVHCYNQSVMVSVDGKHVVCNVTTGEPDAWLIELQGRP